MAIQAPQTPGQKLPVLESATHGTGMVSLWPYSIAQSELTHIHGERA